MCIETKTFEIFETFKLVKKVGFGPSCKGCFFHDNDEFNNSHILDNSDDPCNLCEAGHIFERHIALKQRK